MPGHSPAPVTHPDTPAGRLTLVVAPTRWLAGFEARLLMDAVAAGKDAFLVSGDNRIDAYGLLAQARARGLETEMADGVRLARGFTVHQLVAILEDTLPRFAKESALGVVLCAGLLEMFLDEDVPAAESRVLFRRSVRKLRGWAATMPFPVVATVGAARGERADLFLKDAFEALGEAAPWAPPRSVSKREPAQSVLAVG